jgi:cytochrome bd-type quinol oxidase subunit 2
MGNKEVDNNFFKQSAKSSWVMTIIALAVGLVTQNMFKTPELQASRLFVSFLVVFIFFLGLILGIVALFGIKRHGKKGILKPAIIGISLNAALLILVFFIAAAAFMQHLKNH